VFNKCRQEEMDTLALALMTSNMKVNLPAYTDDTITTTTAVATTGSDLIYNPVQADRWCCFEPFVRLDLQDGAPEQ
jgi:hypothetical protein